MGAGLKVALAFHGGGNDRLEIVILGLPLVVVGLCALRELVDLSGGLVLLLPALVL